jgi:hypothetical protein
MATTSMIRVSASTRDRVMRVAREDYGGVSADEALRRLVDEHWQHRAIAAADRLRREDPEGYADDIDEMGVLAEVDIAVNEPWDDEPWDDEPWDDRAQA